MKWWQSMQHIRLLVLVASLFFVGGSEAFERFPVVSTGELQDMLIQRSSGKNDFTLLNTLDEIIYHHQYIPGSINIPWNVIDSRYVELGEDKNRLIVTYCIGHR